MTILNNHPGPRPIVILIPTLEGHQPEGLPNPPVETPAQRRVSQIRGFRQPVVLGLMIILLVLLILS